jgi:hypothetical protein
VEDVTIRKSSLTVTSGVVNELREVMLYTYVDKDRYRPSEVSDTKFCDMSAMNSLLLSNR